MKGTPSLVFVILATGSVWFGCNPFKSGEGGPGQPCYEDLTCNAGLECIENLCVEHPDGGSDGETDAGDQDPCPNPDCTQAGPDGQGEDGDGDGWGACCDCDDENPAVHPDATEIPYNGDDDDCDQATLDDDLDGDGYHFNTGHLRDCDDAEPAINPGATEVCDTVDNNCDGQTDEDMTDLPCELQLGVCASAVQSCVGGVMQECQYGIHHEAGEETRCDKLDNDCDGQTDEFLFILVPEAGAQATDGVDNNCNGLTDEPGGVMVPIPNYPGVWIDAFEITVFDNPDCTGTSYGQNSDPAGDDFPVEFPPDGPMATELYACSLPGVLPSGHMSWRRAYAVCDAQGKRLCDRFEYAWACHGEEVNNYPYGDAFGAGACNDVFAGDGQLMPTGSYANCTNSQRTTFDMSGNLTEIVFNRNEELTHAVTGGYTYTCIICIFGNNCWVCDPDDFDHSSTVRRLYQCHLGDIFDATFGDRAFPVGTAKHFLGTRCCLEPPP